MKSNFVQSHTRTFRSLSYTEVLFVWLTVLRTRPLRATTVLTCSLAPSYPSQDVVAAAETGSGKTLAFGLPLLHGIIERRLRAGMGVLASGQSPPTADEIEACERHGGIEGVVPYSKGTSERRRKAGWYEPKDARPRWSKLPALVMCPTRELALQVRSHLAAAAEGLLVRVGAVVGGLSQVKQERVLAQRPDIIVATPGRLWEMHVQGAAYLSDLSRLQYLVLDEADRMVDRGRFQELASLLAEVNAPSKSLEQTYDSVLLAMQAERASKAAISGAGDDGGEAAGNEPEGDE